MGPSLDSSEVLQGAPAQYIVVARPFIFQRTIQQALDKLNSKEAREVTLRLNGVGLIDQVRKAAQLPVETYNTACIFWHKFRLHHGEQFLWEDASMAALLIACKVEDTLKKPRDIICTSYNIRNPHGDASPEEVPEQHSRSIIGLERLMLEAAAFDFRTRHPQKLVAKFLKACGYDKDTIGRTAWFISIDLYRTFAPLKQTRQTMAIACVELAARLHDGDVTKVMNSTTSPINYRKWGTSRAEIMETLLDLLDLYNEHRSRTEIGPKFALEKFIAITIALNPEIDAQNIPRYTEFEQKPDTTAITNGSHQILSSPQNTSHIPEALASMLQDESSPLTPVGVHAQNCTVRFVLDPAFGRAEMDAIKRYFIDEYEDVEVEVEEEVEKPDSTTSRKTRNTDRSVSDRERERRLERGNGASIRNPHDQERPLDREFERDQGRDSDREYNRRYPREHDRIQTRDLGRDSDRELDREYDREYSRRYSRDDREYSYDRSYERRLPDRRDERRVDRRDERRDDRREPERREERRDDRRDRDRRELDREYVNRTYDRNFERRSRSRSPPGGRRQPVRRQR